MTDQVYAVLPYTQGQGERLRGGWGGGGEARRTRQWVASEHVPTGAADGTAGGEQGDSRSVGWKGTTVK